MQRGYKIIFAKILNKVVAKINKYQKTLKFALKR